MSTTTPSDEDSVSGGGCSASHASAGKQSQARRAQVRSAQIRHRQRKAHRINELESDVSQYRDMIAAAIKAAARLREENEVMRRKLAAAGIGIGIVEGDGARQRRQDALQTPEYLTVTLTMDEEMGTPAFRVSSPAASASENLQESHKRPGASPYNTHDDVWLTLAQEEAAINFILSLEHVCWNHYDPEHKLGHHHLQEDPTDGTGHTLMASSYCMAAAPEFVYDDRESLPSVPGSAAGTTASTSPSASPASLRWSAPHISLQALRGLASSLNPGDLELTPVQAWFELSDRYPIALLLEGPGSALEALRRELNGLVRCQHYGAIIERMAFESVVSRTMDPALWELQRDLGIDL